MAGENPWLTIVNVSRTISNDARLHSPDSLYVGVHNRPCGGFFLRSQHSLMTSLPVFDGFPHVLQSQQFHPDHLDYLFRKADHIRKAPAQYGSVLTGQKVAVLFSEPSSRTFNSFQEAAEILGARVRANQHMAMFSSEVKGETPEDTAHMFTGYGYRYFVLRRKEEGSVEQVADAVGPECVVINAGDGSGQHPTQALLDVYTIWREFGGFDRQLTVGMLGDLEHGRTVHSLVYLLAKFPNIHFVFFSPEQSRMKQGILDHLHEHGRSWTEHVNGDVQLAKQVAELDVLYVTRPQLERQTNDEQRNALVEAYRPFIITALVADAMPKHAIIMHPLPRTFELPREADANPRARWLAQMENGLWVRTALLAWIQEVRSTQS